MLSVQAVGSSGVLDALGAGFAVHDASGEVLQANGVARELMQLGLGAADAGPACVDVSGTPLPGADLPPLRVLRTGEPVRGFVVGLNPGTPQARWVRVDSAVVTPAGPGLTATVATLMIDVTAETERARDSAAAADRATRLMAPVADVICRLDATDRFVDVSRSACEVLGFAPEDLFGRRLAGMVHVEGAAALRQALTAARVSGSGQALVRLRRFDGELRWVDIAVRRVDPVAGGAAGPVAPTPGPATGELHAVLRDVHDRVLAEQQRADSDRRYRLLADNIAELVCVHDAQRRFVYVSPSVRAMLGHRPEELVGRGMTELVHPDDVSAVEQATAPLAGGVETAASYRVRRAGDAGWAWVETSWRPILGAGGELVEIHASTRDVSERVAGDQALAAAEESFRLTFDAAPQGMARLAPDGRMQRVNAALAAMLGRPRCELEGQLLRAVTHPDDIDPAALLRERLAGGQDDGLRRDQRLLRADGSALWVDLTLTAVRDTAGGVRHVVARLVDTTAERVLGEQLRGLDAHDPLTAAGTGELLLSRLAEALSDPRTRPVAVVRVDLDGFRRLNDARGRVAGDRVLVVTVQRLRAAVRDSDVVARLGGDDFAVLCPGVDHDYVERLGQRLSKALTGTVAGAGHLSASIGIATARAGDTAADVMSRADAALSVVKRSGGAGWAVD